MTEPATVAVNPVLLAAVKEYQCPGCIHGCEPGEHVKEDGGCWYCNKHWPSTFAAPGGRFILGLPKGFSKTGPMEPESCAPIRIWLPGTVPEWDHLNVPVWAMRSYHNAPVVFVRTYMPRLNWGVTDVLLGATELPAGALDAALFQDEID